MYVKHSAYILIIFLDSAVHSYDQKTLQNHFRQSAIVSYIIQLRGTTPTASRENAYLRPAKQTRTEGKSAGESCPTSLGQA